MQKTVNDLVIAVQNALSQVSGSSVQLYSEDQIAASINKMFRFLRREAEWDHLCDWETVVLDGTVGIPSTNMTTITSFEDIFEIFPSTSNKPLVPLPKGINPFLLSGTYPKYFAPYNNASMPLRTFRVYPATSTGTLYVRGRLPEPSTDYGPDDTVPFDADCVTLYAAWDYATDDGTNPAQIEKLFATADARLKQLKKDHARPVSLTGHGAGSYQTEWAEA